jgi:hypothetical protein
MMYRGQKSTEDFQHNMGTVLCRAGEQTLHLEWKHPNPSKVQKSIINSRSDADSFRDSQGPILQRYQERGTTVNTAHYSEGVVRFFSEGIQTLVSHCTKCVEKEEDYVQKRCSCKFCIAVILILKKCIAGTF